MIRNRADDADAWIGSHSIEKTIEPSVRNNRVAVQDSDKFVLRLSGSFIDGFCIKPNGLLPKWSTVRRSRRAASDASHSLTSGEDPLSTAMTSNGTLVETL